MSINTVEDQQGRKESVILQYFKYDHLPEELQEVSSEFFFIAQYLDRVLASGPEKSVGLRKLLEAKDACVRASL